MRGYLNMSLHKLKNDFQINQKNKVIVQNKVSIKEDVLYLIDNDATFKFEDDKWFIKTPLTNNEYISLGLGALPTYHIEDTGVEDVETFNSLFELCDEEN